MQCLVLAVLQPQQPNPLAVKQEADIRGSSLLSTDIPPERVLVSLLLVNRRYLLFLYRVVIVTTSLLYLLNDAEIGRVVMRYFYEFLGYV